MYKSEMIRARTQPGLKKEVEGILEKLGLSASEAINIFYQHIKLYRGLPFDVRIPNTATKQAMSDIGTKSHLIKAKDPDSMIKQLDS